MNGSILNVDKYKVIILDNFYEPHEYVDILDECLFLSKRDKMKLPEETGTALSEQKKPLKKNKALFLDSEFKNRNTSDILYHNRKIFNNLIADELAKIDIYYRYLKLCESDTTLVSYYENEGYYDSHSDASVITCITWIFKEPKSFSGGNIFFEDDKNNSINCVNNRTIFFPSFLNHSIDKVMMDESKIGLGFGRFSITNFIFG